MYSHNRIGTHHIHNGTFAINSASGVFNGSTRAQLKPWIPTPGLSGDQISLDVFYENATNVSTGEGVAFAVALSSLSSLGFNDVSAVQLELSGTMLHTVAQGEHPTLFFLGYEDDDSPVASWNNNMTEFTFLPNELSSDTTGDFMSFKESVVITNPDVERPILFGSVMYNLTSGTIQPDWFRTALSARYCLEDIKTIDLKR